MMKQLHTFDDIFDTQKTFRLLLDAMANPSRVVSIQEGAEKLYGSKREMLTLAMTLLDKNTGFYTFGHTELDEQILLLTHAEKKTLEEADYVFVTEEEHLPEAFAKAKRGTLENPHTSATLIIGCSGKRNVSCSIPALVWMVWQHSRAQRCWKKPFVCGQNRHMNTLRG